MLLKLLFKLDLVSFCELEFGLFRCYRTFNLNLFDENLYILKLVLLVSEFDITSLIVHFESLFVYL